MAPHQGCAELLLSSLARSRMLAPWWADGKRVGAEVASVLFFASLLALLGAAAVAAPKETSGFGSLKRRWWWPAAGLFLLCVLVQPSWLYRTKFLARWVMPAGLIGLLLLALAVRGWRRTGGKGCRRRRVAWLWTSVLLVYGLGSSQPAVGWMLRQLEQPAADALLGQGSFDAVAVLGGGTSRRLDQTPQLNPSGDRVATAARLYHRGKTQRIVCLGNVSRSASGQIVVDLAADMARILQELGVPKKAVIQLRGAKNTAQEIAAVGTWMKDKKGWRVGLITSAWHMRRALRLARRAGLGLVPVPGDFRSGPTQWDVLACVPNEVALYNLRLVVWEMLGALAGR